MITLEDKINVSELLSGLQLEDLLSLSSTVTRGLLKPKSREEANEAILQHSEDVESILNRQKVTKELIFNYLNWKKLSTGSNRDKKSLIKVLLNYWNKEQLDYGDNISTPCSMENFPIVANNQEIVTQCSNEVTSVGLDAGQVHLLGLKFAEWFYQLLNKDFLEGGDFALGTENFWNDASLHLKLNNGIDELIEEAEGSEAVVELLYVTKQRHTLYFSPNLCAEGVQGRSEPHGLVSVLVCGTLHQSAGVVLGIFEQVFYLMKDPLTNDNWKVKRSQMNLTSKTHVLAQPTLTQGSLTAPLLSICNPD